MKRKTAAEWQIFIDELLAQKKLVQQKIHDAELVLARNRLPAFSGEKDAKHRYDAAGADVVELSRQLNELTAAIDQAHAEVRRAAHAARAVELENAVAGCRKQLDEHEQLGGEIDEVFAQLLRLLERRAELVSAIIRSLPSIDGITLRSDIARALHDNPSRIVGAMPLALCPKLGVSRPWPGERKRYADQTAALRSRAEGAMKSAIAALAARDPDAAPQRAAPATPERAIELPRDPAPEPPRQAAPTPASTALPESAGNDRTRDPGQAPALADFNRMPLDEFIARHWDPARMTVENRGNGEFYVTREDERLRGPMTKEDAARLAGRAAA